MNRILLVEDDEALCTGIAMALGTPEVRLTACRTLAAARAALAGQSFELLILDVNLPDGSALDLVRGLRPRDPVPVLLLTANDLEVDIVNGLEAGADDYVTKPFSLAVLRARVAALVGVLNFANALLTSILARRREFAMLQAVGMTGRQLRRMLVTEGLLYAALAGAAALVLCLLAGAAARTLQDTLWFFTYRFSLLPLAVTLPCFAALGALLPPAFYHAAARRSLVERLRQAE